MKRIVVLLIFLMGLSCSFGQQISFLIQDGLSNTNLKTATEKNISLLLTEINSACVDNRPLQLDSMPMTSEARQLLDGLWNNYAHFSCDFDENVSKCIRLVSCFEVREIFVTLYPAEESLFTDALNRELIICFSDNGELASVHLGCGNGHLFSQTLSSGYDLTDSIRRLSMLHLVERYDNCFLARDANSLGALFTTDEIHYQEIAGQESDDSTTPMFRSKAITNRDYIRDMKVLFESSDTMRTTIKDIKIEHHMASKGFYGVSFKHDLTIGERNDRIYVFMLCEFYDSSNKMIVHMVALQPYMVGEKQVEESLLFDINDCFVP